MTEIEKHNLAVRTKYNELKIAIEEAREFGLSPALWVRCFLNDNPIFREPSFNEYEYDNQEPPPAVKLICDLSKAAITDTAYIERRIQDDIDYQQFGAV